MPEHIITPKRGRGRPRTFATTEPASTRTQEQAIKFRDQQDSQRPPIDVLLVTVKRAAEALQVCEKSVWNLMTSGQLPYVKILGSRRIATDDLRKLASTGTAAQ